MTNAPRSITDVEPKNWYQIGFAEGAASRDERRWSIRTMRRLFKANYQSSTRQSDEANMRSTILQ